MANKHSATQYRPILTGCMLLLLTGCSLLGYDYVYNRVDKLLADRIERTLDLTRPQTHRLTESLETFHQQHRQTELPYYVAYFDYVNELVQDNLTEDEAISIQKNLDILYARLMMQFIPILTSTLNALDNDQLTYLEKQFAIYNDEKNREFGIPSGEERLSARIIRHQKAYAFWLGRLTVHQKTLIENNARSYPDIEPLWQNRRLAMQQTLLNLLWQRADSDTLEKFLYRWWVEDKDKPPALAEAEHRAGRHIIELTVRIFESLETHQKIHVHSKLDELARSLEALLPVESRAKIPFYHKAFLQNAVQLSVSANCFSVAPDKTVSSC